MIKTSNNDTMNTIYVYIVYDISYTMNIAMNTMNMITTSNNYKNRLILLVQYNNYEYNSSSVYHRPYTHQRSNISSIRVVPAYNYEIVVPAVYVPAYNYEILVVPAVYVPAYNYEILVVPAVIVIYEGGNRASV